MLKKNFKLLSKDYYDWNILHSKCIVKAINKLTNEDLIKKRLIPLAWVHDIGKIKNDENHAKLSVKILEEKSELDKIDRDCILNHGSSGKPITPEGKIFRCADGISLFYPEILEFRFKAEKKEGRTEKEIKNEIKIMYEKYLDAYKDNQKAIELLKKKYGEYNNNFTTD